MLPNNKNRLRGSGPYGLFLFLRFNLLMRAAPEGRVKIFSHFSLQALA